MKLIIDVPEEYYKSAKLMVEKGSTYPLKVSIANGTPLDVKIANMRVKKEEILHHFQDINFYYNDCMMYADLSSMVDELIAESEGD